MNFFSQNGRSCSSVCLPILAILVLVYESSICRPIGKLWYKLIHRSYHHYRPRHLCNWTVVAAQFPLIPCITCICSPIEGRRQIPTWLAHLWGPFHYGSYYWYQICEDWISLLLEQSCSKKMTEHLVDIQLWVLNCSNLSVAFIFSLLLLYFPMIC